MHRSNGSASALQFRGVGVPTGKHGKTQETHYVSQGEGEKDDCDSVYKTLWGKEVTELHSCTVRLNTYIGHKVQFLGAAVVKVQHKQLVKSL